MKILPLTKALESLDGIRASYETTIRADYEHRAKSCLTCQTPGACCLDEHFVNVRISRLEAVAINNILDRLPETIRGKVRKRIDETIVRYALAEDLDMYGTTFACPLFEKGVGCLVHQAAKPLPCIHHACYENAADLPPDELLSQSELEVEALNRRTYGAPQPTLPIPLAIKRFR